MVKTATLDCPLIPYMCAVASSAHTYTCTHIYTKREKERERNTERQKDRDKDRAGLDSKAALQLKFQ